MSPNPDGELQQQAETSLGGEGPIVNVSGVQLADGRWVVAGNDCDSTDTVDPEGCAPGTTTVAIVDGAEARTVEHVPSAFEQTFVTARGTSSEAVLFETWDTGTSTYWTMDTEGSRFTEVAWKPERLPVPDQVLTDANLDDLQPARRSCIVDDHILVVDGVPSGSGLETTASLASTTTGQLVVDDVTLELGPNVVMDRLLCAPGVSPQLVAIDHRTNQPLAFALEIGSESVEAVAPVAAPAVRGPLVDITYGPTAVAIQYMAAPPEVTLNEPASPGEIGTVTSSADVGVIMFDSNRWERVTDVGDGSIRTGERVYPLPGRGKPLVVHSVQSGEYRAVG